LIDQSGLPAVVGGVFYWIRKPDYQQNSQQRLFV